MGTKAHPLPKCRLGQLNRLHAWPIRRIPGTSTRFGLAYWTHHHPSHDMLEQADAAIIALHKPVDSQTNAINTLTTSVQEVRKQIRKSINPPPASPAPKGKEKAVTTNNTNSNNKRRRQPVKRLHQGHRHRENDACLRPRLKRPK